MPLVHPVESDWFCINLVWAWATVRGRDLSITLIRVLLFHTLGTYILITVNALIQQETTMAMIDDVYASARFVFSRLDKAGWCKRGEGVKYRVSYQRRKETM